MDNNHIQSYCYVDRLLDTLVKFRNSSLELLRVMNHNTEVFLGSLVNITSDQHNTDVLQHQFKHIEDNLDKLPEGTMDEVSIVS
nr:unnamed protein product [Callosobruchus analis]